ncbi:MAG: tRNA (adenosine(37)-N6)-threonylcarbamoyltransferase complex dimerization subunit type 1 TsaB [Alphaproteobacteria bacterium]|nr:tRNA (adenosine(37)-N6)-threonylcarbamoyltransferase complex dimerization subunit type 1 TsaB [Alphaproteobacteria bacterium]
MKLLAIDTATSACSVALLAGGRIVAERSADMQRGHAEALMPMVAEVLAASLSACPRGFADLDLIAVTAGPGAFTGVRIGLAAAGAMAAAAGIPAVGLTTLEVVAAAQPPSGRPLLVALDAKRADVYCQLFGAGPDSSIPAPLTEPQAILPADLPARLPAGPVALAGDGAGPAAAALRAAGREVLRLQGHDRPEAAVLARLAAARWQGAPPPLGSPLRPLYLRAPDVSLPARGA